MSAFSSPASGKCNQLRSFESSPDTKTDHFGNLRQINHAMGEESASLWDTTTQESPGPVMLRGCVLDLFDCH